MPLLLVQWCGYPMRKHSNLSLHVLLVYDHHQYLNFPAEKREQQIERERAKMITDTLVTGHFKSESFRRRPVRRCLRSIRKRPIVTRLWSKTVQDLSSHLICYTMRNLNSHSMSPRRTDVNNRSRSKKKNLYSWR